MATAVRNYQIAESPSERFERVTKKAIERAQRARARRAKQYRNGQITVSQQSR